MFDVTSTVTLAVPVQLPFAALRVYVVFVVGETDTVVFEDPVDQT